MVRRKNVAEMTLVRSVNDPSRASHGIRVALTGVGGLMDAGLVTSMSGALAQSKRVEVIANNLANTDTPGFKADGLAFEETLMGAHRPDNRSDVPEQPMKESEFFSQAGEERRPVLYGREFTDLRSGGFRQTGNPLDVAIEGNGFLEVLTPNGVRLTRAGNMALDPQGRLVTRDGFLVLGPGDATPPAPAAPAAGTATASLTPEAPPAPPAASPEQAAARAITVGSVDVNIDAEGNLYTRDAARTLVGRLGIVQVENPTALVKEGRNLFVAGPDAFRKPQVTPAPAATAEGRNPASATPAEAAVVAKPNPLGSTLVAARVHQGMLESSNVNPIVQMTEMIEAHRLFDQNTKLMQSQGEALGRLSDIGRF